MHVRTLRRISRITSFLIIQHRKLWLVKISPRMVPLLKQMKQNGPSMDNVDVLYKSDHYLIINKNYDISINSSNPEQQFTVEHQLRRKFPELVDESVGNGFRFQHQLDHATSGVLSLALNKKANAKFGKCMEKRQILKHYLALVRGHVPNNAGLRHIKVVMGRDSSVTEIHKMCTEDNPHCTKHQMSHSGLLLLQHGLYHGQPASKVLLMAFTGRTHQLRLHCRHIGHLIVGDYTYSDRTDSEPYRMMLHAYRMVVPLTGEHLDIMAPDPFTHELDELWLPQRTFRTYTDCSELTQEDSGDADCGAHKYVSNINEPGDKCSDHDSAVSSIQSDSGGVVNEQDLHSAVKADADNDPDSICGANYKQSVHQH